jgi:hypothetical protein
MRIERQQNDRRRLKQECPEAVDGGVFEKQTVRIGHAALVSRLPRISAIAS